MRGGLVRCWKNAIPCGMPMPEARKDGSSPLYPCGCARMAPCEEHARTRTCPGCGLSLYGGKGPICSPLRCDTWTVVGKSKNGGPLLRLVPDA